VPQCTTSTSNSDSADIPNLPNLDNSVELTVEVAGTNAYGTGDKSSVGQIVGTPPVTLLTTGVSNKQISVSWKSPSEFTPSDPASNPSGSTVTLCATASSGVCKVLNTTATSVVFSQLNTSTQYSVSVRAINQYGTSAPAASNADFPVSAKNLTIQNLSQTSNGMVNLVAYGVYPGLSVTLGISGHKQHCTADPAGECTVSFTLAKPGAYGILATLGTQTATSESWFPSISTPSSVKHGSPFPVTIGYGAKGAPVVVTTSDGKTYTGKVGGSGSAVVMVPTTTPKFLTLNFTVGGVSFPARKVQVS